MSATKTELQALCAQLQQENALLKARAEKAEEGWREAMRLYEYEKQAVVTYAAEKAKDP